jgi:hypothetical protein
MRTVLLVAAGFLALISKSLDWSKADTTLAWEVMVKHHWQLQLQLQE